MESFKIQASIFSVLALAGHFVGAVRVQFYEHSNFDGQDLILDFDRCTNVPPEWNDRISSVNTWNNCVKVFEHGDCRGKTTEIAPGTPSHNHLDNVGFQDSISSVNVCGEGVDPPTPPPNNGDWQQDGLSLHNEYRRKHNARPLALSDEVHRSAQKCADYLASIKKMEHLCKDHLGHNYGENLGSGYGSDARSAAREVTKGWYSEVSKHDFNNNYFQYPSGHFSQVVWKNTQRLGFGYARNGDFNVIVAHYDPSGNFEGQFLDNVERAS